MNRRELAKAVAVQSDVNLKTVTAVLDGFSEVVTAVVASGEPVAISGFAKFVRVKRAARMGRNPATGEAIKIKASQKARIAPLKAFKDVVLGRAAAPKLAKGAWPVNDEAVRRAGKVAAPAKAAAPARKKAAPARKKAAAKRGRKPATTRRTTAKKTGARRKVTARAATTRRTTKRATTKRATTARRVKKTTARRPAPKKTTRRPAAKRRTTRARR